jgi:hypothetical protein
MFDPSTLFRIPIRLDSHGLIGAVLVVWSVAS